jgi:preprotein translocase subunit SecG
MQQVLIVIHLLVVVALIGTVLLQRSEGGVLGSGGGGGFMTGRGQANALSRATAVLATLYFVTALAMSILASWGRSSHSALDTASPAPAQTQGQTAPKGNLLDQLKNGNGAAPAAPSAPAPAPTAAAPAAPAAPAPAEAPK